MQDVQSRRDYRELDIDKVGVKGLQFPIIILDRKRKIQHSVGQIDISVSLPKAFKGTHMSRFIEILSEYRYKKISLSVLAKLAEKVRLRLKAEDAHIEVSFPYFIEKKAPVTKKLSLLNYQCKFVAAVGQQQERMMEIEVPITTLCPCSKAISKVGAHNQRSYVRVRIKFRSFIWLEEIITLIEEQASCQIYPLLKREDEKFVTEAAYNNPKFAEDIVRDVAGALNLDDRITWYSVESENQESIHNHSAYAYIEK